MTKEKTSLWIILAETLAVKIWDTVIPAVIAMTLFSVTLKKVLGV
jgi:hypothetical protein